MTDHTSDAFRRLQETQNQIESHLEEAIDTVTQIEDPYNLIKHAQQEKTNAYNPYSGYSVGAAIQTKTGHIYTGANIEGVTYDMASHAERTALKKVLMDGSDPLALAISTESADGEPPCSTCRQYLSEFCDDSFPILSDDGNGEFELYALGEINPYAFRPNNVLGEMDQ